jgi:hypothetical protein
MILTDMKRSVQMGTVLLHLHTLNIPDVKESKWMTGVLEDSEGPLLVHNGRTCFSVLASRQGWKEKDIWYTKPVYTPSPS